MKNRILVVGLGKSGRALVEVLLAEGHEVEVYDSKSLGCFEKDLQRQLGFSRGYFNELPEAMDYDFVAMSPGVSLDEPVPKWALRESVPLKGELEIAFERSRGEFVGITGTNGKTTTTTLTYEIFKEFFPQVALAGNIGFPAVTQVGQARENTIFVTEISSFQLETIEHFKPKLGGILNITPDHLNRHKTLEAYTAAKLRLFENYSDRDVRVLNYDDDFLRSYGEGFESTFFFSRTQKLKRGCWVRDDGMIVCDAGRGGTTVMSLKEIRLPGVHNLENVLAALSFGFLYGIPASVMARVVGAFKGVEHRLEIFAQKRGITFINDSKATNPEATIKAIEAMDGPTILIAGGMDKGSDFSPLIDTFSPFVKHLCLYGETREIFKKTAQARGYPHVSTHEDLGEALAKALEFAGEGDRILLSPACASWDMYDNFEVRGRHFKNLVNELV
ncbi:MAG: hypothetical protein AVO33_02665 [delta proteobacterium ML8_F1]|nr:MAG: hypothetical protein AVO33_02665 [delta proteobacterium ML8_F1]